MVRELTRIQKLAQRVWWLDRHRRLVAILIAACVSPMTMSYISEALGAGWPQIHTIALAAMFGAIVWMVAEVCLAALTALWDSECSRLMRDESDLPRAALIVRGKY